MMMWRLEKHGGGGCDVVFVLMTMIPLAIRYTERHHKMNGALFGRVPTPGNDHVTCLNITTTARYKNNAVTAHLTTFSHAPAP